MAFLPTLPPRVVGGLPRVDGSLKVTGSAVYSSDFSLPGMLYAVPVCATIAKGTIVALDTSRAQTMPGVKAVFSRHNIGRLFKVAPGERSTAHVDERRPPFEDDIIRYYGQYVAAVVAETFEQAMAGAAAVKVSYRSEKPDVQEELADEKKPKVTSERGHPDEAFTTAAVKIDETYCTPVETHNPMELHASVATWDGQSFTLFETTQGVVNARNALAQMLGVATENVRVISRFLGSGFGSKLFPWPHSLIAAAAARHLGRPVKLVVSRAMMFQNVGHRPQTQQRLRVGATSSGTLVSLMHDSLNHTSMLDDYTEHCTEVTSFSYSTPNLRATSGLVRRNVGTPTSMRGPGAVPGLFALESAIDELAIALKMDPVALRLENEPKIDEGLGLPFSSRHIVECLKVGAEKFGWYKRTPAVGSMKKDGAILGWGVACCSWIAERQPTKATMDFLDDGTARVSCAVQDIGTGTYTVLTEIVAEKTGLPYEKIRVILGDTALAPGPISGGSWATASIIPAVLEAIEKAKDLLFKAATAGDKALFTGHKPDSLAFTNGFVHQKDKSPKSGLKFEKILTHDNIRAVSGQGSSEGTQSEKPQKYSKHSFGAQFAEVTWRPELARLSVSRVVTVIDGGTILNPKPAKNQIQGAVVMGIGMALFEKTTYDQRFGNPINNNFADYIVATNADAPNIDVTFLNYPDKIINALGARGIGEIGLAGVAPAITAAVYHATGVRVRELPVRIEDLIKHS